jgi:hypothetical protein
MVDALDEGVARHTRLLYAQRKAGYMAVDTRRLYRSANGDRWDLEPATPPQGFSMVRYIGLSPFLRANAIRILELTSESTKRLAVCLEESIAGASLPQCRPATILQNSRFARRSSKSDGLPEALQL